MSNGSRPQQPQVEVVARFGRCPWCGSTDFMMKRLAKEMVEDGQLSEGVDVGINEIGGPIIDPSKAGQMLTMSTRPGMFALRDICVGCGRDVTVKIEKKTVMIEVGPPSAMGAR